jgi:hypothetical protein
VHSDTTSNPRVTQSLIDECVRRLETLRAASVRARQDGREVRAMLEVQLETARIGLAAAAAAYPPAAAAADAVRRRAPALLCTDASG